MFEPSPCPHCIDWDNFAGRHPSAVNITNMPFSRRIFWKTVEEEEAETQRRVFAELRSAVKDLIKKVKEDDQDGAEFEKLVLEQREENSRAFESL